MSLLKFLYSEKATKFCKICTLDLTGTTWDKSTMEISQKFVAFSEYMNFKSFNKSCGAPTELMPTHCNLSKQEKIYFA